MSVEVVDTSAIVALLLGEPGADRIERTLLDGQCVISAATWVELAIVIEARAGAAGAQLLAELRDRIGLTVHAVDESLAQEALIAWRRFGRGRHPAGLNFADTCSYALARHLGAPLLSVGDGFAQTDIGAA